MKYLFFGMALLSSLFLFGQKPMKKYPVTSNVFWDGYMIFNNKFIDDNNINEALVKTNILTETQLKTALKYAQMTEYPEALNTVDKLTNMNSSVTSKYKGYWIGSWVEFFPRINDFRRLNLVWIPKEDNLTLQNNYIPKSEEGFYIITNNFCTDIKNYEALTNSGAELKSIVEKLEDKKMKTEKKIDDIQSGLSFATTQMRDYYSTLKNKYLFSVEEIKIISGIGKHNGWPDSLVWHNYSKLNDLKYYKLGEQVGEYGVEGLFWVSPNQSFPNGYKPKYNYGFFFFARINESEKRKKKIETDVYYLNTSKWLKEINSTNSYDASTYIFSNGSGSSNSNNGFTTTTVNGVTVATGKLERTNSEMPPKVKLPSGCATKDMKERFGYVNDDDTRWGNYKKGAVIAAYNTALAPKYAHVFNVNLQKNTTYNIGVIFSTKDRKGALSAHASYEISVRSSIPGGYSWSNTYDNTGYIIVGNEDIVATVSITGSKYYDLRDTEKPEPVCSIVYVDKLFN